MRSCAILGASGHGKVIAEIAELNGYQNIIFFDDRWPTLDSVEHWPVSGNTKTLIKNAKEYDLTIVAIGNNEIRLSKYRELVQAGAVLTALIHPSSVVSQYVQIGEGTVVMANAVINPFCNVGMACIINTGCTIDHDCYLADGVHISPGVNLAGGVGVGECSWVGIGSQVKQLIKIGSNVTVGAGATVINNIPNNQMVVGSPAHLLIKS